MSNLTIHPRNPAFPLPSRPRQEVLPARAVRNGIDPLQRPAKGFEWKPRACDPRWFAMRKPELQSFETLARRSRMSVSDCRSSRFRERYVKENCRELILPVQDAPEQQC